MQTGIKALEIPQSSIRPSTWVSSHSKLILRWASLSPPTIWSFIHIPFHFVSYNKTWYNVAAYLDSLIVNAIFRLICIYIYVFDWRAGSGPLCIIWVSFTVLWRVHDVTGLYPGSSFWTSTNFILEIKCRYVHKRHLTWRTQQKKLRWPTLHIDYTIYVRLKGHPYRELS